MHTPILKGILGCFEFTVLLRNLKERHERGHGNKVGGSTVIVLKRITSNHNRCTVIIRMQRKRAEENALLLPQKSQLYIQLLHIIWNRWYAKVVYSHIKYATSSLQNVSPVNRAKFGCHLHGNFLHTRHEVTQMHDNKAWLLSHKKRQLENHWKLWIYSNFYVLCSTNYTSLREPISKIRSSELNFVLEMTKEGIQPSKDFINETESPFHHTLSVDCPSLQNLDIKTEAPLFQAH